jgi:hypothetical protein
VKRPPPERIYVEETFLGRIEKRVTEGERWLCVARHPDNQLTDVTAWHTEERAWVHALTLVGRGYTAHHYQAKAKERKR